MTVDIDAGGGANLSSISEVGDERVAHAFPAPLDLTIDMHVRHATRDLRSYSMAIDVEQLPLVFASPTPVVEIRRSTRRRKTVAAHWEGDRIVVVVPQRMSRRDRQEYADELAAKLMRARERTHPSDAALLERATALAHRYLDASAVPSAVTWSSRQQARWGSCSVSDRTIRISDSLRGVPPWVLDAVLLHELVHLIHPEHDESFNRAMARYPRNIEADAFLAGYELGLSRECSDSCPDDA